MSRIPSRDQNYPQLTLESHETRNTFYKLTLRGGFWAHTSDIKTWKDFSQGT